MEPTHNNDFLPAPELPQPQEASGQEFGGPKSAGAAPETRGFQPPSGAGGTTHTQSVPQVALPVTPPVSDPPAQSQSDSPVSTAALVADDADLIEKEWVLKAKAIVMQTKSDPYTQNVKMGDVKADYLKKRYNKDIKVSGS
ncbi:MAG TPA: hypothetical protein VM124_01850 [Candidatus Limnocylindrales bacterium]|nr:hypothetical protein [Candidatus Limnocylindrales bacterium]